MRPFLLRAAGVVGVTLCGLTLWAVPAGAATLPPGQYQALDPVTDAGLECEDLRFTRAGWWEPKRMRLEVGTPAKLLRCQASAHWSATAGPTPAPPKIEMLGGASGIDVSSVSTVYPGVGAFSDKWQRPLSSLAAAIATPNQRGAGHVDFRVTDSSSSLSMTVSIGFTGVAPWPPPLSCPAWLGAGCPGFQDRFRAAIRGVYRSCASTNLRGYDGRVERSAARAALWLRRNSAGLARYGSYASAWHELFIETLLKRVALDHDHKHYEWLMDRLERKWNPPPTAIDRAFGRVREGWRDRRGVASNYAEDAYTPLYEQFNEIGTSASGMLWLADHDGVSPALCRSARLLPYDSVRFYAGRVGS